MGKKIREIPGRATEERDSSSRRDRHAVYVCSEQTEMTIFKFKYEEAERLYKVDRL